MNYYERIQRSIDYIEENICEEISLEKCAFESFMSLSEYYRMFFSIIGMNVKEYIRQRRLTLAFSDLIKYEKSSVMETAVKYGFQSADGFSRAFKKQFGILPSKISDDSVNIYMLERINIMEKLFESVNTELTEKYPDIKVIRELPEMKVACYTYYGNNPEDHAYEVIKTWFRENEMTLHDSSYRLFGYNNPDPKEGDSEYAYEYCITIPDELYDKLEDVPANMQSGMTYSKVYRKVLHSGKYAVLSVKREGDDIGYAIMAAWKRFINWIDESKYVWGHNQYLEEHLGFSESDNHIGGVDLYFSIEEVKSVLSINEMHMDTMNVLEFREEGKENFDEINKKSWARTIEWLNKSGLKDDEVELFQYNHGFCQTETMFNVIAVKVPENFDISKECEEYVVKVFEEHSCICVDSQWPNVGDAWHTLEKWCRKNKGNIAGQWLEKCEHKNFHPTGNVTCILPIKR